VVPKTKRNSFFSYFTIEVVVEPETSTMPWVKSLTRFDQPKPTSKKQSWWAKM
jgi:hypothetical protein